MNENEPQNIDQSASGESAPPVDETTTATSTGNEQQTTVNDQQAAANVAPIAGDVILQVHIANIFLTFCQKYARLCDRRMRRFLEFVVLIKAIGAVCALIYAHVGYPMSATCLNSLKGKIPVESILRVEIGKRNSEYITPFLYRANAECPTYELLEDLEAGDLSFNHSSSVIHISKDLIKDLPPQPPQYHQTTSASILNAFMFDFGIEFVDFYRFEFSQEYGYLRLRTRRVKRAMWR